MKRWVTIIVVSLLPAASGVLYGYMYSEYKESRSTIPVCPYITNPNAP